MRIVDAHQHFWTREVFRILQCPPEMERLDQEYGPEDLEPLLKQAGVDRTVLVQTHSSLQHTAQFLEAARPLKWVGGVVGWVDLAAPNVGDTLDMLKGDPKFKGVRHQWHDEPDPGWLAREEPLRGLRELEKRGIPYDLLIKPFNWEYVSAVIEAVPNLPLVIDHIGKPQIASHQFDDWSAAMADWASHPNLYCKVSGMVTEADWHHWKTDDLRPYVEKVMELFGPSRVMFGSDWPVCLLAGSYSLVMDVLQQCLEGLSEFEKAQVMGETATAFYKL